MIDPHDLAAMYAQQVVPEPPPELGPPGPPPGGPPLGPPPGPMGPDPSMMGPPPMGPDGGPPPEKKDPPLLLPQFLVQQIARQLADRQVALAKTLVGRSGAPDGYDAATTVQQLKLWRMRDPNVDIDALREQGVPEDEIVDQAFPARRALVMAGNRTPGEQLRFSDRMASLDARHRTEHLEAHADNLDQAEQDAEPTPLFPPRETVAA